MRSDLSSAFLKLSCIGCKLVLTRGVLAWARHILRKPSNIWSLIQIIVGRKLLHFAQKNAILDNVVRVLVSITFHKFTIEATLALDLIVEARAWTILILPEFV